MVSTVSFSMLGTASPTTGPTTVTASGPESVAVGGKRAGAVGGSVASRGYTLSFDGEPLSERGHLVRVTVSTPGTAGPDTQSQAVWVPACAAAGGSSALVLASSGIDAVLSALGVVESGSGWAPVDVDHFTARGPYLPAWLLSPMAVLLAALGLALLWLGLLVLTAPERRLRMGARSPHLLTRRRRPAGGEWLALH